MNVSKHLIYLTIASWTASIWLHTNTSIYI